MTEQMIQFSTAGGPVMAGAFGAFGITSAPTDPGQRRKGGRRVGSCRCAAMRAAPPVTPGHDNSSDRG